MLKINILAVGTIKETYWQDAIKEYLKRLSKFVRVNIVEINEEKTQKSEKNVLQVLEKEGEAIIKAIKGTPVALDIKGEPISSENLSSLLNAYACSGKSELSFIIGGSWGLSESVKLMADKRLSFGAITLPHQLMRVVLLEQLYRAITIRENINYHK